MKLIIDSKHHIIYILRSRRRCSFLTHFALSAISMVQIIANSFFRKCAHTVTVFVITID